MRAIVLREVGKFAKLESNYPDPTEKEGWGIVKLEAAAFNRRDYWICKGLYPAIQTGVVIGSDGAGIYNGEKVVLAPALGWVSESAYPPDTYEILGMPSNGTFADYISVPEQCIYPKPTHLSMQQAAALPLAGLTAYRALFTKGKIGPGEKVLVSGVGGGVAMMAVSLALTSGAQVYVTSSSDVKLARAYDMGVKGGANYSDISWEKKMMSEHGLFDLVIDSGGGDGFAKLLKLTAPGGRIVIYGGSAGKINGLSPQLLFWRQISIMGTSMGSNEEFGRMLSFVEKHRIVPVIDKVLPLGDSMKGFERLDTGSQFGKIVMDMAK